MNQSKSALKSVCKPLPCKSTIVQLVRSPGAAHCSHQLAPFSAFFHKTRHSSCIYSYIAPQHSLRTCLFPLVSCYTLWVRYFVPVAVVRSCMLLRPTAEPLVRPRPTRASSASLYRPRVHVVRFCPTCCSTTHHLAWVGWLTHRVSSTPTSFAIGIGKPFFFGARMHRAHAFCNWRTRPAQARRGPGAHTDRYPSGLHQQPLRGTSSRLCVSTHSHWLSPSRSGMAGSVVLPGPAGPSPHTSTPLCLVLPKPWSPPTPKQTRRQRISSYLSSHTFHMHGALPNRLVCHIDHTTSLAAMPYQIGRAHV